MTADVVIVGAGSAGCVLASRLSEDASLTVLLVEAGDEAEDPRIADPAAWPALQKSAIDWDFVTVPQPRMGGRAHAWPRGRVVGGSSAMHAMGHMRGHPADFDAWAAAGATGWGWQDLLPFFAKSETSPFAGEPGYGTDGPLRLMQPADPHPLTRAHVAAGIACGLAPIRDHNGPGGMSGPTLNTLTIRDGCRQSIADAYLRPEVRRRANLEIRTGLLVDRLSFGAEGRVTGVEALEGGRRVRIDARGGVVLAAGAIGTPCLLMRSGLGPAGPLSSLGITVRRRIDGIGANLQDHLLSAGNVYRASRPVPPTGTQHSESLTYIASQAQDPGAPPELVVGCVSVPVISDALTDRPGLPAPGEGYTLMFGITHPRSRGNLSLVSADPHAQPRIDPAYLTDEADRAHFLEALDWARRLGASRPYDAWRDAEILPAPEDLASRATREAFVERAAFTHHHPVGTCRMGTDPDAVVGPDLSVPGTAGLFVCDGAILPSLPTGPVNAAIVAVAERGATLLSARFAGRGAAA